MIEVEFLGTGTSTGVPQLGCECEVCKSADPRDKRLRCSAIVRTQGVSLLIDCGPDFRQQMLRASDLHLDALLITHSHYDHVGGMDDLRPYCREIPFPVYAQPNVVADIKARIPYCFREHLYPGVPTFDMHPLAGEPFEVKGVRVEPLLSHMNLEETLAVVAQANPRRALLIHESDGIGLHEATSRLLPQGVELAYDKEIIRVP